MGRRLVKAAGEMGCRDYRAAAPSVGAERPDVRHSASILGIPHSRNPTLPDPAKERYKRAGYKTDTTVGFEGFEGGERGARSQRYLREPYAAYILDHRAASPSGAAQMPS